MKPGYWSIVFLFILIISSFSAEPDFCRKTGIKGHVYLVRGNQMPSPDMPASAPPGMKTILYVYELTNISQVGRQGTSAFYSTINTRLVKEVQTDDKGAFSAKLKPGRYSLFVKKDGLYYSSQFDDKNNIHPVEVKSRNMTEVDFKANYSATY